MKRRNIKKASKQDLGGGAGYRIKLSNGTIGYIRIATRYTTRYIKENTKKTRIISKMGLGGGAGIRVKLSNGKIVNKIIPTKNIKENIKKTKK